MLFSVDDKHLIKVLREKKQYTACEFLKEFLNNKWSRGGLNHLLKKINKFGCAECLARVVDHRKCIMLKTSSLFVHNEEDRSHSHCSVRQIAREAHISRSTVYNIINKYLQIGLKFIV